MYPRLEAPVKVLFVTKRKSNCAAYGCLFGIISDLVSFGPRLLASNIYAKIFEQLELFTAAMCCCLDGLVGWCQFCIKVFESLCYLYMCQEKDFIGKTKILFVIR